MILLQPLQVLKTQSRSIANFMPKKMKYKKRFKGTFPARPESLRGKFVQYGDFGLQTIEGGRLSDLQLDTCRNGAKRALKFEKGSEFLLRCFPDRPVTAKAAETRMGKGKGAVDYYATWLAPGRIICEIKGARLDVAQRALKIAGAFLPLRTRIVKRDLEMCVPPRVLPYFIKERLRVNAMQEAIAALPDTSIHSLS